MWKGWRISSSLLGKQIVHILANVIDNLSYNCLKQIHPCLLRFSCICSSQQRLDLCTCTRTHWLVIFPSSIVSIITTKYRDLLITIFELIIYLIQKVLFAFSLKQHCWILPSTFHGVATIFVQVKSLLFKFICMYPYSTRGKILVIFSKCSWINLSINQTKDHSCNPSYFSFTFFLYLIWKNTYYDKNNTIQCNPEKVEWISSIDIQQLV